MMVRQHLGELLNEVQYQHGKVVITKAGKPVAALIDIAMFERIRKMDDEFENLRAELSQAFAGMDDNDVDALVGDAITSVRSQRPRK